MEIYVMTKEDIPFAVELTCIEQWGYLEKDYQRLIRFEPEGCFVAWESDRPVGIVTTTSYGDYAFLGCLIVRAEHRGIGRGEALMEHAISYLKGKGVETIELDAVFLAVSLYRRLGFQDKYLSLRFYRAPTKTTSNGIDFKPEPDSGIAAFDRMATGLSRERILERYVEEFKNSFYIRKEEEITGYAVVRPRAGSRMAIAPWVAISDESAESILSSVVANYGENPLSVGSLEENRSAVAILTKHGFTYAQPSLRMFLGKKRDYEKHVFGLISPEKG